MKSAQKENDQDVHHSVDMSPGAILDRLRQCAEVSELCRVLKQAGQEAAVHCAPNTRGEG
ncbi:MAG: hypothetical protein KDA96_09485 [Planctomycetaceae bacterium]|nr:hypothetical protein [Planctomycetaceae bacterium]